MAVVRLEEENQFSLKTDMKTFALPALATALGLLSAAATTITYSGMDLSGLTYLGNPATDAAFVSGTPDYANLYTANAFIGGDVPQVAVTGPLGTLTTFSASYVALSQSGGGAGNSGYWDLIVSDPNNAANTMEIIAFSGTAINGATQVHTPGNLFGFGTLLSSVYGITDGSTTLGNWIVDSAGVAIGNFGNTEGPMDLQIASISLDPSSVPDVVPTGLLLGLAIVGLVTFRRWQTVSTVTK